MMSCLERFPTTAYKQAVARAFSKAASTYDDFAVVQQYCAEQLLRGFTQRLPAETTDRQVLDLGCGSGFCLPMLQPLIGKRGVLIAADLSNAMLQNAKAKYGENNIHYQWADAEQLPFETQQLDGVFSNLMIQWCDAAKVLHESVRVLKPGGVAAFSTLVAGSLDELSVAWQSVDAQQHVNVFNTERALQNQLNLLGAQYPGRKVSEYSIERENHTLYYPSVKEILKSLKGIGANFVKRNQTKSTTRSDFRRLEEAYEAKRRPQGLPVTYEIAYLYMHV